jgi:protoporphyrinogen/coproporphyrinogen III oxidase
LTGPSTVVVAGGGITGLAAARDLEAALPNSAKIVLVEATGRLGGKIHTTNLGGAVVEAGPDWFLTRSRAALELCRDLGLASEVTAPRVFGTLIWSRGALRRLPSGLVRGFPSSPTALLRLDLLSIPGRLRALGDLALPGPLSGRDVSVGSLVRRRFGAELLERAVDPVLAGSRAGRADEMSLAAGAPEIDAVARSSRSVTLGLRHLTQSGAPPFAGLTPGMSAIVDGLRGALRRTDIRLGAGVDRLSSSPPGYRVALTSGDVIDADGVVVAVPADAAARIVEHVDAELTKALRAIDWASAAVLSLLYPPGAVTPPRDASGFLVPSAERKTLTACAWYSAKWTNARPPDGRFIMRCFAGRAADDPAAELDDDELRRAIVKEIAEATGIHAAPVDHTLTRWQRALPQFAVGHLELVERIERLARSHAGLAFAGAGYRGSGLTDCIEGSRRAAHRVVEEISRVGR